jgi:hypothetical protein
MSLTISGIFVAVFGTILLKLGFSEVCSNEIIANAPLAIGSIMAYIGRIRKGDLKFLGTRKA